jgi:hypothetical protein
MTPFEYVLVGASLLARLEEALLRGHGALVLGARGVGKTLLMAKVYERLLAQGVLVAQVHFLADESSEEAQTARLGDSPVACLLPRVDEVLAWLHRPPARRAVLLASNVDALPHAQATRLVEEFRQASESGRAATLFTGEADGCDLVCSERPGWLRQFVLQGFERDEFWEYGDRFLGLLGVPAAAVDPQTREKLYAMTGGLVYLLHLPLWAGYERQTLYPGSSSSLLEWAMSGLPWNGHFRYLVQQIGARPGCWPVLEGLIRGDTLPVPGNDPTELELVGAATRTVDQLHLPDGILARFLREHYTTRRFADLHAVYGKWDGAFSRYRQVPQAMRVRPLTLDDVADASEVVRRFCSSLHGRSSDVTLLKRHFAEGCRGILGFAEVTYWQWQDGWRPERNSGGDEPSAGVPYQELLPPAGKPEALYPPSDPPAYVARLSAVRSDRRGAVVVTGNPLSSQTTSRARDRLTRQALDEFVTAHERAVAIERRAHRLRVLDEYAAIVNGIVAALGVEIRAVDPILDAVASGLRKLGYARVLLSLVDATGRHARIVQEEPSHAPGEFARETLAGRECRVHEEVVQQRRTRIVPRSGPADGDGAGSPAVAIIPLLAPGADPLGTLLVQCDDGEPPSPEEVSHLEEFVGQLAVILTLGEQVSVLLAALDWLPEPVFVADRAERLRYVNLQAARYLPEGFGDVGWRRAGQAVRLEEIEANEQKGDVIKKYTAELKEALHQGEQVRHFEVEDTRQQRYNVVLYAGQLTNEFTGEVLGAVGCSLNLSYLYRVFEAVRHLAGANDLTSGLDALVEATKILGHRQGLLYRISEEDGQSVHFGKSYGFPQGQPICGCPACQSVYFPPQKGGAGWEAWKCLVVKRPMVFCSLPGHADGERVSTRRGLDALNVSHPLCPLVTEQMHNTAAPYWIDFPLQSGGKRIGKIRLDCSERHPPDDFAFLSVLCEVVSARLEAWQRLEVMNRKKEKLWAEMARQVLRLLSVRFGGLLAAFDPQLHECRRLAKSTPLQHVVSRMGEIHKDLDVALGQARRSLGLEAAERHHGDLTAVLREAFEMQPGVDWTLNGVSPCQARPWAADVDPPLLRQALEELIENAWATRRSGTVRVEVTADSFDRGGREWVRLGFSHGGESRGGEQGLTDPFSSPPGQWRLQGGLGLFLVRQIVEAHGGDVRFDAHYHEGTRFVIEFPRYHDRIGRGGD